MARAQQRVGRDVSPGCAEVVPSLVRSGCCTFDFLFDDTIATLQGSVLAFFFFFRLGKSPEDSRCGRIESWKVCMGCICSQA